MRALVVIAVAYLAGSIPFSNIAAHWRRGVDLRDVGSGTVGGSALFKLTDFGTLSLFGIFEVAKGAVGPLLAGPSAHPVVAADAGGAAVIGHNWSPWLRGAGGRGFAVALGALLVTAWTAAVLLLVGLIVGVIVKQTGLCVFVAELGIVPVATLTTGVAGALAGIAIVVPMLVKRVMGNRPPEVAGVQVYLERLVFDRE
jgi:glycerol-3-phosphate acyltransferase PlsY